MIHVKFILTPCVAPVSWQVIRDHLQGEMTVMCKSSPADLVTMTDQKVEELIMASIMEKFPTHR